MADPAQPGPRRWVTVALGVLLVLAVYIAGSQSLDAPWLQGDEHIFIVNNPEVTGAGLEEESFWRRLRFIFRFPPEEDLYQPLPILTYAVEWTFWGDSPEAVRRTDVLLHALNGLLLWWVLRLVLMRVDAGGNRGLMVSLSWALALVWSLHPVNVNTYAADMGRTHLLSATFALLSLGLHLHSLKAGRGYLFAGALAALVAAMLCKAIVGWVLLAVILEAALLGRRAALRSPRLYLVAAVCAGFAFLTYWTSQRAGLVQDAAAGLFGDPVSRSALAVWIYFRNLVAPFWLSWWHLPDPRTAWTNPLVWLGLLLAAGSIAHAVSAWRRAGRRAVAIGWAWCWAMLLPLIGLIGAREAAATDRYLYQPLMGIMLVVGILSLRWILKPRPHARAIPLRPILLTAGLLGAVLLLWDLPHVRMYRTALGRAHRVVRLNPGDPRALEALAAAYDFAANHALPADDPELAKVPATKTPYEYFLTQCVATLRQAAAVRNLVYYFPGPDDRAPFHRRLSHMFKMARWHKESLEQARIAQQLEPDAMLTWVRLAHAYHGLGRWDEAIRAYERCEELLPDDDPVTRATHFTDFGYLLVFDLEPADALSVRDWARLAHAKFAAAIATGHARPLAHIGLARCEIRVGQGARGYEIVSRVLDAEPDNPLAGLVLAEYHLRSHHWNEAAGTYGLLLAAYPTVYQRFDWYYEALRGFQAVCAQLGRWRSAALAWEDAVRAHPASREFRSFRVWAVACAGAEDTAEWANELLATDPDNPLACLALALQAVRRSEVADALDWVRTARRGIPVRRAREFERAAATLRLVSGRGELPPEAAIIEAATWLADGQAGRARTVLEGYSAKYPDSGWATVVRRLGEEIDDRSRP